MHKYFVSFHCTTTNNAFRGENVFRIIFESETSCIPHSVIQLLHRIMKPCSFYEGTGHIFMFAEGKKHSFKPILKVSCKVKNNYTTKA